MESLAHHEIDFNLVVFATLAFLLKTTGNQLRRVQGILLYFGEPGTCQSPMKAQPTKIPHTGDTESRDRCGE